jgi:hypothetical protein
MRKTLGTAFALAGVMFGIGSSPDPGTGDKLFLVYSTDERGELHPCG